MMEWLLIITFILGYAAITLEHPLKIDKAASALLTGVICWVIYVLAESDKALVAHHLDELLEHDSPEPM